MSRAMHVVKPINATVTKLFINGAEVDFTASGVGLYTKQAFIDVQSLCLLQPGAVVEAQFSAEGEMPKEGFSISVGGLMKKEQI